RQVAKQGGVGVGWVGPGGRGLAGLEQIADGEDHAAAQTPRGVADAEGADAGDGNRQDRGGGKRVAGVEGVRAGPEGGEAIIGHDRRSESRGIGYRPTLRTIYQGSNEGSTRRRQGTTSKWTGRECLLAESLEIPVDQAFVKADAHAKSAVRGGHTPDDLAKRF